MSSGGAVRLRTAHSESWVSLMTKAVVKEMLLRRDGDMAGVRRHRETLLERGHLGLLADLEREFGPVRGVSLPLPSASGRPLLTVIQGGLA